MTTQKQQKESRDETPLAGELSTVQGQNALRVKVGKHANWLVTDAGGIKLCVIRHSDGPVDPLRCLNACAELEKTLTIEQCYDYDQHLVDIIGPWKPANEAPNWIWHATAEQRCRAFVTTMEGKQS